MVGGWPKAKQSVCPFCLSNGGNSSTSSVSDTFWIVEDFDLSKDNGVCRKNPFVWSLNIPPKGCYGWRLNIPGYALTFSLDSKGRNNHILDLTFGEEMHSPLSRQEIEKKTSRPGYIFYKFNSFRLCEVLQQCKFRLSHMFIITIFMFLFHLYILIFLVSVSEEFG